MFCFPHIASVTNFACQRPFSNYCTCIFLCNEVSLRAGKKMVGGTSKRAKLSQNEAQLPSPADSSLATLPIDFAPAATQTRTCSLPTMKFDATLFRSSGRPFKAHTKFETLKASKSNSRFGDLSRKLTGNNFGIKCHW